MFRKLGRIKAPETDRNELKWLVWSLNIQVHAEDDLSNASNTEDSQQIFYSYHKEQTDLSKEENFDGRENLNLDFYYSDDETNHRPFLKSYDEELSNEFEPAKKKPCR